MARFKLSALHIGEAESLIKACGLDSAYDDKPNASLKRAFVIWTLLDTGLRVGELSRLVPNDFDGKNLTINGDHPRKVSVTNRTAWLLRQCILRKAGFGISERMVQRMVQNIAVKANLGKRVTPSALRHTYAQAKLLGGATLAEVATLLGQELSTTQIYLRDQPEQDIQASKVDVNGWLDIRARVDIDNWVKNDRRLLKASERHLDKDLSWEREFELRWCIVYFRNGKMGKLFHIQNKASVDDRRIAFHNSRGKWIGWNKVESL